MQQEGSQWGKGLGGGAGCSWWVVHYVKSDSHTLRAITVLAVIDSLSLGLH